MRAAWERLAQLDRKRSEELETTIRAAYDAVVVELEEAQGVIERLKYQHEVVINDLELSQRENANSKATALRQVEELIHDGDIKVNVGGSFCEWKDAGVFLLECADKLEKGESL